MPRPGRPFEQLIPLRRRVYTAALFSLLAALLYADQNLLAPNLSAAAADFGFSEAVRLLPVTVQFAMAGNGPLSSNSTRISLAV